MDYVFVLTIPANTLITAPVSTSLRIPQGEIVELRLDFPTGSAGLANVRLFATALQIYPSNLGGYYRGDGVVYLIRDRYPLKEVLQEVKLEGYNEDDTYSHTITVGLTVIPRELARRPSGLADSLRERFGFAQGGSP